MAYVKFREPTSLITRDQEYFELIAHVHAAKRADENIIEQGKSRGLKYTITNNTFTLGPLQNVWFFVHFLDVQFPQYHIHEVDGIIPFMFSRFCDVHLPHKVDLTKILQLDEQHLAIMGDRETVIEGLREELSNLVYEAKKTKNGFNFEQSTKLDGYTICTPLNLSFFSTPGIYIPCANAGENLPEAIAVAKGIIRKALKHQERMQQVIYDVESFLETSAVKRYEDTYPIRKKLGLPID